MNVNQALRRGVAVAALALVSSPLIGSAAFAAGSPPAQPTSLALTSANRALGASWQEVGFKASAITFTATARATGHATHSCRTFKLSCSITSLVNGVSYNVTVTASNKAGKSAPSAVASATVGVPGPPLSVHVFTGKSSAKVSWAPPKASGVSAITGYTATALPGPFSCSTTGAQRSCTITGLTKGTKYSVTVTATNKYGTGPSSKAATFTSK